MPARPSPPRDPPERTSPIPDFAPPPHGALAWLAPSRASGPVVARAFHRALALVFLIAWLSLAVQVRALIGKDGLSPLGDFLFQAEQQGFGFADLPTPFWWFRGDGALIGGALAGAAVACLALFGVQPRACFAVMTPLYLGYAVAGRTFLSFQWDNLLLECGVLAAFLPRHAPSPWLHALLRVLLVKLYLGSGIAKWQSPIGDWHDGSAMTFYYETAPLPTWLGWYAHALPETWHRMESWLTLLLELVVPFAAFGSRKVRLGALAALTAFQLVNAATANYGFFVWLAVALHLFLLDDADLGRVQLALRRRLGRRVRGALCGLRRARRRLARRAARAWAALPSVSRRAVPGRSPGRARSVALWVLGAWWALLSTVVALDRFTDSRTWDATGLGALGLPARLRLVNVYHLFGQITRDRIEPEVQTTDALGEDGDGPAEDPAEPDAGWRAHDLRHKPGDPGRAPGFVAPHQPRLDFQLWFYGLAFRRGMPAWVASLLDGVCDDPARVQGFFAAPLPEAPARTRMVFWRYRFSTPEQRRETGAWWTRDRIGAGQPMVCRQRPDRWSHPE
ncbi:MAG: lipase maturation factor family protein [Polyangiaceae bacterium]